MKILIMTDSPNIPTGMGRLGRELSTRLRAMGHEIGYIGWWHPADFPQVPPPGVHLWVTNNSHHGSDVLDGIVNRFQPDVLLTIGDFWHLWYISDPGICRTRRFFQWCSYIPVDGEPLNGGIPPAIRAVIEDIDIPVAYTDYAKNAVLKSIFDKETRNRIRTIYHGVDTELFKPMNFEERVKLRDQYGIGDKFLFLTVSRNQSRKNIPELLRAWKQFSEIPEMRGKVCLWPHMYFNDPMGWKIDDLIDIIGLRNNSLMYYEQVAHAQSELFLLPDEELAKLYQIADAFILLSGEGFGLPTFEAMASKIPCILLDYAASSELGADGRAELVPVTGSFTWTGSHLTQRPIPEIDQVVKSMVKVFSDMDYRKSITEAGYKFAKEYTWDRVATDWNNLFIEHEVPFLKPMKMEVVS